MPQTSGGFTHIIDFTDPMKPIPVGRYHLEDYGSHDIIVQDDILYQAYYDGGVRLVDVSGELMGNLVDQNREIAVFKPFDPTGYTANAPFVMNAMPWKKDFVLFRISTAASGQQAEQALGDGGVSTDFGTFAEGARRR